MPLSKPLADIKNDLQGLIALGDSASLSSAISSLQNLLPNGADKRNQSILLESRLNQINGAQGSGTIKSDDYLVEINRIKEAVNNLIAGLNDKDFDLAAAGASTQAPVAAVPKFVVIYDEKDKKYSELLNKHLNVLVKYAKKIRVYNVHEALVGENAIERAKKEMADADYLVVLITVNLFNSEWFGVVYDATGEGRRMVPIRMEHADFEDTGLEKLKSLPSGNRAVSDFKNNPDDAYVEIVRELKKLLPQKV